MKEKDVGRTPSRMKIVTCFLCLCNHEEVKGGIAVIIIVTVRTLGSKVTTLMQLNFMAEGFNRETEIYHDAYLFAVVITNMIPNISPIKHVLSHIQIRYDKE